MLVEKPKLNPAAEKELAAFKAEGISFDPADVLWLQHLADRMQNPHGRCDPLEWVDVPYRVGNLDLWPLSLGAEVWLRGGPVEWFEDSGFYETLSIAYAMAFSRTPEAFQLVGDKKSAKKVLWRFAGNCGISFKSLHENVSRIMNLKDSVELSVPGEAITEPKAVKWGDLLAMLCHELGGTVDDWLWKRTSSQISEMIAKLRDMNRAPSDKQVDDDKVSALLAFNAAVRSIRERGKSNGGS